MMEGLALRAQHFQFCHRHLSVERGSRVDVASISEGVQVMKDTIQMLNASLDKVLPIEVITGKKVKDVYHKRTDRFLDEWEKKLNGTVAQYENALQKVEETKAYLSWDPNGDSKAPHGGWRASESS